MTVASLRKEYSNLTNDQLKDKVYELAFSYQKLSKSCAQSVVASLCRVIDIDNGFVQLATSFTGGHVNQTAGTCGGLIGGTMVLDYFFGRPEDNMSYRELIQENIEMINDALAISHQLYKKYYGEYGSILCPNIQVQLLGRHFYLWDPQDMSEFERLGGYRKKCAHVLGNAANWVMDILINNGTIKRE
jgi:C_GCAxxG_C_C family probable redox protein